MRERAAISVPARSSKVKHAGRRPPCVAVAVVVVAAAAAVDGVRKGARVAFPARVPQEKGANFDGCGCGVGPGACSCAPWFAVSELAVGVRAEPIEPAQGVRPGHPFSEPLLQAGGWFAQRRLWKVKRLFFWCSKVPVPSLVHSVNWSKRKRKRRKGKYDAAEAVEAAGCSAA